VSVGWGVSGIVSGRESGHAEERGDTENGERDESSTLSSSSSCP
jgi:hypothetical protein